MEREKKFMALLFEVYYIQYLLYIVQWETEMGCLQYGLRPFLLQFYFFRFRYSDMTDFSDNIPKQLFVNQ